MSSSNNNNNQKRERAYDPSRLTVDLPATAARPNTSTSNLSTTERLRSLKNPSISSSNSGSSSSLGGGTTSSSSSSSLSGFTPSFAPKVVERRRANASDDGNDRQHQQRFQRREFKPKFEQKNNRPQRDNNRPFRERTPVTPTFAFGGMEIDTDDTTPSTTTTTNDNMSTAAADTEDDKKLLQQQLEMQQQKKNVFEGVKQPPTVLPFAKPSSDLRSEEELAVSGIAQMGLVDSSRNEEQLEHVATRALFRDSRETTRSDELLFLQLPSSLPINLEKLRRERERRELEELRRKQAAELQQAGAAGAGDSIAKNRQLAAQKEQERLLKEKLEQEQKHKSSSVDDEENIWTIPFDNTLLSIPNGYIGEMVVHKSGKTKLKLGDVWFDVVPGSDFAFMEHVAAVAPNKGATYILGDVAKRVMCMPDVDKLLYDAKKNPLPVLPHPGMSGAAMRGRGRGRGMPPTRGAPGASAMGRGGRGMPPTRGGMVAGRGGIPPTSQ